ncbi:MAG: CHASE2 domain-containing protein, partial [Pseudomonadota bacterium]
MTRRVMLALIIAFGATFHFIPAFSLADLKLLDLQFATLRALAPRAVARDVVVVGIDEDSIRELPEPLALWHKHLGRFLQAMVVAQPAAVGVDIVLPDRSYDAVAPGYDTALLRGILEARRAYPLVLALSVDPAGAPRPIHKPFVTAAGQGATAYALLKPDIDGVVRRFDERLGDGGEAVATFAGQIARRLGFDAGNGLIDYTRGARFDYIPLQQVLAQAQDMPALERAFRGRTVLLGIVLPFEDRQRLPVPLAAWQADADSSPGVLLHAQVLRSLLGNGIITTVSPFVVAALSVAAALLWLVTGRVLLLALAYAAGAGLLWTLSTALLFHSMHLPVAGAALTGLLALGGRNAYEAALQLQERRRLRKVFSGYVSPPVMQQILAGRLHAVLGGEKRFICALFSDIRGYTARSESMTPEDVVSFLNRYFEEAVALIHARGGTVTSFMGDGIMAVFGAPNALDNPCLAAFEAGRDMLRHVARFNAQAAGRGEQPLEIGVGLHAGDAVVGHIGSSTRHDYTAIGDVINVASRLESLTKEAGVPLACSRAVVDNLPQPAALAHLGPMAIKGHTPV